MVHQKTGDSYGHTGESAYWEFANRFGKTMPDGTLIESTLANPDSLADTSENKLWGAGSPPELAGRIIERFMDSEGNFPALSRKENEILKLYTATGDMDIVCKSARVSRSSVNTYLARIRSKFLRLLPALDL